MVAQESVRKKGRSPRIDRHGLVIEGTTTNYVISRTICFPHPGGLSKEKSLEMWTRAGKGTLVRENKEKKIVHSYAL